MTMDRDLAASEGENIEPAGHSEAEGRPIIRVFIAIVVVLFLAQIAMALFAYLTFRDELAPQLQDKAQVVGKTVGEQMSRAVELGIPFDKLVGMEGYLQSVLSVTPDIDFLYVETSDGADKYSASRTTNTDFLSVVQAARTNNRPKNADGTSNLNNGYLVTSIPVLAHTKQIANLYVGIREAVITSLFQDIFWDVLAVLAVSLLVALELLVFFMAVQVNAPVWSITTILDGIRRGDFTFRMMPKRIGGEVGDACRSVDLTVRRVNERFHDLELESQEIRASQIDQKIIARIDSQMRRAKEKFSFSKPGEEKELQSVSAERIRAPLFVFMFSEELSRSFLPLFAGTVYKQHPVASLSPDLAIGLPITIFMAVVALVTPLAGSLTDRYGARRIFVAGTMLAVLGYGFTVLTYDFYSLIASRAVSAIGYGLVFIASQGYIADAAKPGARARNMAIFVGAVLIAGVCGPAIGGILADRIGFRATFAISILLGIISALLAYRVLDKAPADHQKTHHQDFGVRVYGKLLTDMRFIAVTFFIAIPTKMVLAGVMFYLTPVYLFSLDNSASAIGRIMMIYGIVTVLLTPIFARYADQHSAHRKMAIGGGLMTALSCISILLFDTTPMVLVAVAGIGLSHAMSLSNQTALIQEIGESRGLARASVMSGFRLLERMGTVLGPILVGALLIRFDYQTVMAIIGVIVAIATFIYVILSAFASGDQQDLGNLEKSKIG